MKEEIKNPSNFCGIYYIKTMETYSVRCKKYTANKNSNVQKTKLLSNCAVCGKKKSTFIKNQKLPND